MRPIWDPCPLGLVTVPHMVIQHSPKAMTFLRDAGVWGVPGFRGMRPCHQDVERDLRAAVDAAVACSSDRAGSLRAGGSLFYIK